jgi:integrase
VCRIGERALICTREPSAALPAELIGAFLDHLQHERRNSIRTATCGSPRSTRCFPTRRCAAPERAEQISRVLAIPAKRRTVTIVSFLTATETAALLAAPDTSTPLGRRDHALLLTAIQTGEVCLT